MSRPHVEWEREFVTKYSNISRVKNGLRKTYFYENECKHHLKSLNQLECPLCQSLFECCQRCYIDFCESEIEVESWDDLICPDCIEQCNNCQLYITEENGSRESDYPYDLHCLNCDNDNNDNNYYDGHDDDEDNEDDEDDDDNNDNNDNNDDDNEEITQQ